MRHDVEELARFPNENSIRIDVELVRKLAPESLVVTEFKEEIAKRVFERLYRFPTIGKWLDGDAVEFSREFSASDDDFRFNREEDGFPIYEGKMIEQFNSYFDKPSRWISKAELKKTHFLDRGDWQHYRFAIRRVASITNQRSLIASVLPKECLTVHSLFVNINNMLSGIDTLYLVAFFNSFILDFVIRNQATANVTQFLIHQLPVPRLTVGDKYFAEIVERAAKLICTTPEFDDLAKEVGLGSHKNGVRDDKKRTKLRAELDGMIAHLYGLTEQEFVYILTTFPIIAQYVKDAALETYRELAPKSDQQEIGALINAGENAKVELKSSLRWDVKENRVNKALEQVVVKTMKEEEIAK
ncbi:MAG TPA: hypothetical protein VJ044_02875, partial [Candidatus Hodarchaeales archaeon]|nr:hypothetical protein [Candidatus Hodarchaeales archaeon]